MVMAPLHPTSLGVFFIFTKKLNVCPYPMQDG